MYLLIQPRCMCEALCLNQCYSKGACSHRTTQPRKLRYLAIDPLPRLDGLAFNRCYNALAYKKTTTTIPIPSGSSPGLVFIPECMLALYNCRGIFHPHTILRTLVFLSCCLGVLVPYVNTCYKITPTDHTFFKR